MSLSKERSNVTITTSSCNGNIIKLITYLYTARLSASNCAWSIPLGDILFSCIFLRSQPPAAANINVVVVVVFVYSTLTATRHAILMTKRTSRTLTSISFDGYYNRRRQQQRSVRFDSFYRLSAMPIKRKKILLYLSNFGKQQKSARRRTAAQHRHRQGIAYSCM